MSVAHRMYARALFEAAREQGRLEPVRDELSDVAAAVESVPELRAVLENPELEPTVKASVLVDMLGGEADALVRNFVRLLAEKGRAADLPEIAREYDALVAAEQRILSVELTTAYTLSDPEAADIVQKIEHASGRPVEATRKVDPELIGGIVLQAGSMRLDASVRGRLQRLRQELTTARS
jgi:F-type H+-transporting ATPase subunit delta